MPGTQSSFTRNAGMKRLWRTSAEVMDRFTGLSTGTLSTSLPAPPEGTSYTEVGYLDDSLGMLRRLTVVS